MSTRDLLNDVASALADGLPELAIKGLDKALESVDADDTVGRAALALLRRLIETEGTEALNAGFAAVARLVEGTDPNAAFTLRGQPDALDALVDALQTAEAEQRRRVAAWVVELGELFTAIGGAVLSRIV